MTSFLTLIREARNLASEDGENTEYDRALVELIIRVTPGLNHDEHTERIKRIIGHVEHDADGEEGMSFERALWIKAGPNPRHSGYVRELPAWD